MTVEGIEAILHPGVQGLLNKTQATNLVLSLILYAMEPANVDMETMQFLARFLTPQDYDDLVQERALTSICGYPLCSRELLDTKGHKRKPPGHPLDRWKKFWCSPNCYQSSAFFREQLSTESLITRRDVAWARFGHLPYETRIMFLPQMQVLANAENKTVAQVVTETLKKQIDVTQDFAGLSIDTPALTLPDIGELAIKENESPAPNPNGAS